jgi:hypothetical protein
MGGNGTDENFGDKTREHCTLFGQKSSPKCSLFYLFLKLEQINYIFFDRSSYPEERFRSH